MARTLTGTRRRTRRRDQCRIDENARLGRYALTGFREEPEHLLDRWTDEELIGYIRAAQAEPHERAVEAGMWRLVDRYSARVRAKVQGKMPNSGRAEEIAQDVLEAAVRAVLAGKQIDSFKAWIFRVAANKIADFWRSPEGQELKAARASAAGDDSAPASDGVSTDDQDLFELEDVVESLLGELRESHRRIVELSVFEDLPARAVAEETGESADNVYQVVKRFRDELRRRLDTGGQA